MQKIIFAVFLFVTSNLYSQVTQNDNYQFFIDLNKAGSETLDIELITPKINSEVAEYKLPSMVPGTYKIYDFGRFVSDLKAFDNTGNELQVNKKDINTWEISSANNLYRLTYKIDDTFGDTSGVSIFEPAGTSIDKDTVFVFNNHGFFGYFNEYLGNDYKLNFRKPSGFYGSTSLVNELRTDTEEIFNAPDYNFLVDNPVMFCVPDTVSINFEETKVLLSVYSPGKGMTAADLTPQMTKLLNAIRTYLGGKFSADRYTFLYYFSDKNNGSGMFGALEHNYSSFYYMPDVPKAASSYMVKQLMSTSAHEFYHTVTPLNLHSEEIGNFDFNDPKMSEHLWLYEGVTEYNADYIQLREGLIKMKDYSKIIEEKMNGASGYNDTLPFTVMSKGALDIYEDQYQNVYQKGALIGLCLDILI
ncbi:MAG TPA: peptidase M61, partial [Ignavibacteria bacterium]|nr:peptidase M61 [Ignavibacteria bacterium]